MNVFTDVYEKSIEMLKTKTLDESWSDIEGRLKLLLGADGPNHGEARVLSSIRNKLAKVSKSAVKPRQAKAEEILKAARCGEMGFQDRAALVKTMKHFYFVRKSGNQKIWVVDSPKAYDQWTYDLFDGRSETTLKSKLRHETETFGRENRKMMSDALQLARKWSNDIVAKLGAPDERTLKVVKRWFHRSGAKEASVKKTAGVVLGGFKKIAAGCNSTSIIFSDRPHLRAGGGYDDTYASVNATDVMPVVYIFKLFLEAGQKNGKGEIGMLWLCALTIIHELSHKLVGTDDIRYDDDGLKPQGGFNSKKTINNADTWGYFAANMVGALSTAKFDEVYQ